MKKTVADAIADGTLPELPEQFINRVARLKSPVTAMLRDDVPIGDAAGLIDDVERGEKFRPRGKGTSPLYKMIVRNLTGQPSVQMGKVTHSAVDVWWELKDQASGWWSFDGEPAGALCEIWYRGQRVCASFQSFQNLLSKARKTLKK